MKANAIILASVMLVGCQASSNDDVSVQQHGQSLSAAGQGEAGKYTDRATSARWLDNNLTLAQNQDLWNFISDELRMGVPENSRIREQKQKYLKHKSYLHDVTVRAEPYMYWIAGQVKKRNMPMELVLLPIVESAFDPHATSARSAAGIWQIIPSTGRSYGLKQTDSYDARRDIVASTTAALNIMQRLNRMFNGDWLLTIAAYNSGEGRVMKAIKANKAEGKPTDFWSLPLPQETQLYIPKMLALSEIFKNNQRYGLNMPIADKNRALARVDINNPVALTQLADMAGMPINKLKAYNAGVRDNVLGKNGPQYVMVPKKHVTRLKASLASSDFDAVDSGILVASNTMKPMRSERVVNSYIVRSGDTLSTIAARQKVSTKDLLRLNNLTTAGIKPGQKLKINGATAQTKIQLANNRNDNSITYRVRKGDSLSSIAKRHGVKIKDLERWNSDTVNLKPGDQLTLFVKNSIRTES